MRDACECFAAFARASEATKYAATSIGCSSRASVVISRLTGIGELVRLRCADEDALGAWIEPDHGRQERRLHAGEHVGDLMGHRREELGRWDSLRDKLRDAPQRRLLLDELSESLL
jgi:hypothetical protein